MFSLIFIQLFQKSPPLFFQLPLAQFAARSIPVPLQREARLAVRTIYFPCGAGSLVVQPVPAVALTALGGNTDGKVGSTRRGGLLSATRTSPESGSRHEQRGGQGGSRKLG